MKFLIFIATIFLSLNCFAKVKIGQIPPAIELSGKDGGLVSGKKWESKSLMGKTHILFYVDPDESDANKEMENVLKESYLPVKSVAIINMDATLMPNFAIEYKLEEKQELSPNTAYVKDFNSILVKKWGLNDDSYDVIIFNKEGKVIYTHQGTMSKKEISKMIGILEKETGVKSKTTPQKKKG